ncbi:MAG: hypothetical protein ACREJQ_01215 [bacterium]
MGEKKRHRFMDFLRFAAVSLMIQGHVFRALLEPGAKQASWWRIHEIIHGVTAPAFLFAAGFVFVISSVPKWHELQTWNAAVRKRLLRLLAVVGFGYALHLPYFSAYKIATHATPQEWRNFLGMDILQCIGLSLIACQLLLMFLKTEKRVFWVSLALAVIFIGFAPALGRHGVVSWMPAVFDGMISKGFGGLFPLFPFAGDLFAGVVGGFVFVRLHQEGRERTFLRAMLPLGVGLFVLMFLATSVYPIPISGGRLTNPFVTLMNLGQVFIWVWLCWQGEMRFAPGVSRFIYVFGQESLMVYIVHLIILHGSVLAKGITNYVKPLDLAGTLGVAMALYAGMAVLAWVWNHASEHYTRQFRVAQYTAGILFLVLLALRPF